jgi:hypothetical protein
LKDSKKFSAVFFLLYNNTKEKVENMKIKCVKGKQYKKVLFREGEEYDGHRVNDNWWAVDAIGISDDDFNDMFEMIDE